MCVCLCAFPRDNLNTHTALPQSVSLCPFERQTLVKAAGAVPGMLNCVCGMVVNFGEAANPFLTRLHAKKTKGHWPSLRAFLFDAT